MVFISITTANVVRYENRRDVESDNDFGGVLTELDFLNAENPLFYREPKGGELNDDADNLFEGDIMVDEAVDELQLKPMQGGTLLNDRKWPKTNGHVIVPYTLPSASTEQNKDTRDEAIKQKRDGFAEQPANERNYHIGYV